MNKKALVSNLAFYEAGLVNNRNICIKDMGTSFGCVCPDCIKVCAERMKAYLAYLQDTKTNEK